MRIFVVGARHEDFDDELGYSLRPVAAFRDHEQAEAFVVELNDEWDRLISFQRATEKKLRRRLRTIMVQHSERTAMLCLDDAGAFMGMVSGDHAAPTIERVSADTLPTNIMRLDPRCLRGLPGLERPTYVIDAVDLRDAVDT